jgi:adenylate cyclase
MSNEEKPAQAPANVRRKLAAILAADVKGYSRLMGEDEVATLHTLTAYRQITDALIQQHQGRVVGSAGDSVLAEFASVVDAVQCAVEIQRALKARNAELPEHRRMEFRIGINLGDVMVEGEQIYGDGVNIAARLEALAEAGGICISGVVHDQVKNKLALTYEDLGEQQVKNIAEPVRVWRVQTEESASPKSQVQSPKLRRVGIAHRSRAVVMVGLLLISGTLLTVWHLFRPILSTRDSALSPEAAPAALPLPDKPSIVVLPFVNMSEDPQQDYFSDGITEDLTSALSKLSGLFVISRNSASIYKGKAVKVQEVSKELGVQYVLEGSVRKADGQARITAQLIDATTDHHLWTERYDRPLKDVFALQDEIVQKIVTTLELQLSLQEQGVLVRKTTDSPEAYDHLLRGLGYLFRSTKETNVQARQVCEKAIELDPKYAQAYSALGWTYYLDWFYQWSPDPQNLERAFALAQKAITLDDSLPGAHMLLGSVYLWKKQQDQALAEAERALALNPNDADGYVELGLILTYVGQPQEGVRMVEKAMRLNPHYPVWYLETLGSRYYWAGRYEEAMATYKRIFTRYPNRLLAHIGLAATYGALGREAEARAETAEVLRLSPNFSPEVLRQRLPFKDPTLAERFLDHLRKAGLK